jgi:hypothetical protein
MVYPSLKPGFSCHGLPLSATLKLSPEYARREYKPRRQKFFSKSAANGLTGSLTGNTGAGINALQAKTDRDDALRLAEVYLLGKFPSVAIPEKEVREKRSR